MELLPVPAPINGALPLYQPDLVLQCPCLLCFPLQDVDFSLSSQCVVHDACKSAAQVGLITYLGSLITIELILTHKAVYKVGLHL